MPEILSLPAVTRLKKRAKTIARVTDISPIATHDQVAHEAGYKDWAQIKKFGTRKIAESRFHVTTVLLKLSTLLGHRPLSTTLRYFELRGDGGSRPRRPVAKRK